MKPISISLTQEPDGQTFKIARFVNTSELTVGQTVTRADVDRWVNLPSITVSIAGLTPEAAQSQPSLFEAPKGKPAKGLALAK